MREFSDSVDKFEFQSIPPGSTDMLRDFFDELDRRYYRKLRTGSDENEENLARQKIAELAEASKQTFQSVFIKESNSLKAEILKGVDTAYAVSSSVVAGEHLIQKTWPKFAVRGAVVSEQGPFNFLKKAIEGFSWANSSRLYFIENIKSGGSLNKIIDEIRNDKDTDVLIGIGGGRPLDIVKFVGIQTGIKTVALPTSLTSHVYASPKIHALQPIKELGYEQTIDGDPAHLALLDISILESLHGSHPRLIRAGLGDIMAFYTGRFDWQISIKQGLAKENLMVEDVIDYILQKLESLEVGAPLSTWVHDYNLIQVLLCHVTAWVDSAPASGSEHLFALCAEEVIGAEDAPLHGELVAIGTVIMSYVQGTDFMRIRKVMHRLGLPHSLAEVGLSKEEVIEALLMAREKGRKKNRYTVLERIEPDREFFTQTIDELLHMEVIES